MVTALDGGKSFRITLCIAFMAIWLAFSVFAYPVLSTGEHNIFSVHIDADGTFAEQLTGWELRRQTTWSILTTFSFIGILASIRLWRDYDATYVHFLISLAYFGFCVFFEYCILKLVWSYQTVRMYEAYLGQKSGVADPLQNLLFASNGTLKTEGGVFIAGSVGLIATVLFHIFQFRSLDRRRLEKKKEVVVEKARLLLEEEPKAKKKEPKLQVVKVKNAASKPSRKRAKARRKTPAGTRPSRTEDIEEAVNVSDIEAAITDENKPSVSEEEEHEPEKEFA